MAQHDPTLTRRARILLFVGLFLSLSSVRTLAQRDPAQFKTQSVSVFGGYVYDHVSYGPGAANGGSFGLDLNQHFHTPLTISLEGRANFASGYYVNERSYLAGLRVEYRLGRLHPYGDFELGLGTLHFNPPQHSSYLGDKSALVAGGGGVDFDLTRSLRGKVDYQVQHWDIDPINHEVFTPVLLTFGVTYIIPFRPFHKYGDPHY